MPIWDRKSQKDQKKTGGKGRRANYAPAAESVGTRKYMPVGWANWLGFCLFGLIGIALFCETIAATIEQRGSDPIAAGIMTIVFGVMTYLFATTRVED
ncbi:MAG TPA: hypothetical protein VL422_19625 [Miltoncostaea sp.]|nr:hypothetical protein [Miltoncostaea sp.]